MSLPIVAIVGRPNVGKSSLFNRLVGRKISIIDPTPGVTRDRVSSPCRITPSPDDQRYVELVDTGGIGIVDSDDLSDDVEAQISVAIEEAAAILFVVDARDGILPLDNHVAQRLRKLNKPVILVANKVDKPGSVDGIAEFLKLGFGQAVEVSAVHGFGCDDMFARLSAAIGDKAGDRPANPIMKLAIVGKRNAGKSTFINAVAGQKRVIVSEVAGTTRDSVDVRIEMDGKPFLLIDTAGVRKARKLDGDIEFYSMHRAMRSVRRADVVILMIDASVPVSQVDKDLAGQIAQEFKPVVIVVNKWDLAAGKAAGEDYEEYFGKVFPELAYAPICLTTAKDGVNVAHTVEIAMDLFAQSTTRTPTAQLNNTIEEILATRTPSHKHGTKPPKLYYASQISTSPPTIVCFVNDPKSFDISYQRFLLNKMRETLPFAEVPVRLFFRGKGDSPKPWKKSDND